jgi:hypothetical protein
VTSRFHAFPPVILRDGRADRKGDRTCLDGRKNPVPGWCLHPHTGLSRRRIPAPFRQTESTTCSGRTPWSRSGDRRGREGDVPPGAEVADPEHGARLASLLHRDGALLVVSQEQPPLRAAGTPSPAVSPTEPTAFGAMQLSPAPYFIFFVLLGAVIALLSRRRQP